MTRIGIIGTGSIGSMLARKFVESKAVSPSDLSAYNRSPEKLKELEDLSGISPAMNNTDVAKRSDLIFICVKPAEVKDVITEIRPFLDETKNIVSAASDISLEKLTEWSGTAPVRIIPSVTSEALAGVTIVVFGDDVSESIREEVLLLTGSIGRPFVTTEDQISQLSDITSSSPAIFVSLIQQYALAASRRGGISKENAEFLARETFIGTAKLMLEKGYDFDCLISRVSTEGGITAEGIDVVEDQIPFVFDEVLLKMAEKHIGIAGISKCEF